MTAPFRNKQRDVAEMPGQRKSKEKSSEGRTRSRRKKATEEVKRKNMKNNKK